jgi:hypothetical protein
MNDALGRTTPAYTTLGRCIRGDNNTNNDHQHVEVVKISDKPNNDNDNDELYG